MNHEKIFSYIVITVLLGMAGYYHSAAFAYAAVLSLGISAMYAVYSRLVATKEQKPGLSDETKRLIYDLGTRVATLEYGVKTRGF